jgi:hypothetical protein
VQLLPDKYWPSLHPQNVGGHDVDEGLGLGLEDAEHEEAPLDDVLPLEQLEHELELVPPVPERYRPAAHAVQELELVPPVLERYRPAAHAVQPV